MSEDSLYLLFAELEKGLEEPTRRPAAALVLTNFCANSKLDYQEHVSSLLTVRPHPSFAPGIFSVFARVGYLGHLQCLITQLLHLARV